jgi:hypothetical protein
VLACYTADQIRSLLIAAAFKPDFLTMLNEAIEGEHPLFGAIIKMHLGPVFEQCIDYVPPVLVARPNGPLALQSAHSAAAMLQRARSAIEELVAESHREPLGAFEHLLFLLRYIDQQPDCYIQLADAIQRAFETVTATLAKCSAYTASNASLVKELVRAVSDLSSGSTLQWADVVLFDKPFDEWMASQERRVQERRDRRGQQAQVQQPQLRSPGAEARQQFIARTKEEAAEHDRALARLLDPILAACHPGPDREPSGSSDGPSGLSKRCTAPIELTDSLCS